jgi:hypothetical protein
LLDGRDFWGCFEMFWAYLGLFGLILDVSCNQIKPHFKKPTQNKKQQKTKQKKKATSTSLKPAAGFLVITKFN